MIKYGYYSQVLIINGCQQFLYWQLLSLAIDDYNMLTRFPGTKTSTSE